MLILAMVAVEDSSRAVTCRGGALINSRAVPTPPEVRERVLGATALPVTGSAGAETDFASSLRATARTRQRAGGREGVCDGGGHEAGSATQISDAPGANLHFPAENEAAHSLLPYCWIKFSSGPFDHTAERRIRLALPQNSSKHW